VPGQGPTILKTVKHTGSSMPTRPMSRMAITVEDIRNVQLRKTPSAVRVSITYEYFDIKTFQLQTFNSMLELNENKLMKCTAANHMCLSSPGRMSYTICNT
jgi:hypothetical protein